MAADLRFGTDGWRGFIGVDFDFLTVLRIGAGLDRHFKKDQKKKRAKIVVGYDCRFLSRESAYLLAAWLKEQGNEILLAREACPSPAVSLFTKKENADAGVMITASHNPPTYNGVKFKGTFGGSFTPEMIEAVAKRVADEPPLESAKLVTLLNEAKESLATVDVAESYVQALLDFVNIDSLEGLRVVVDPMHGSSRSLLVQALEKLGATVKEVRHEQNPLFGGVNPEPLDDTTKLVVQAMQDFEAHVGFSLDGDGDRIGARDEQGEFIDSHRIFSLLLKHMVENLKKSGKVVKTISTTDMINRLCDKHNLALEVVPVGFKHICERMLAEPILMGGEESGGIGFADYLPERDGALCALLLCQLLKSSGDGTSMHAKVKELLAEVGEHHYRRVDLHTPPGKAKPALQTIIDAPPSSIAGQQVKETLTLDGLKFYVEGGWLMIRASGTEPLVRFYAEAGSTAAVDELLQAGQTLIQQAFAKV